MRDYRTITPDEKKSILQQHSGFYDGYSVGNVPTNTQRLQIQDFAGDKEGITVTNKGDVKTYRNHAINEKWDKDVEVKKTGKHTNKTINELRREQSKLKKESQKLQDQGKSVPKKMKEEMGELLFAIRAKKNWPKGKGSTIKEEFKDDEFTEFDPNTEDYEHSDMDYIKDVDMIRNMFDMEDDEYGVGGDEDMDDEEFVAPTKTSIGDFGDEDDDDDGWEEITSEEEDIMEIAEKQKNRIIEMIERVQKFK